MNDGYSKYQMRKFKEADLRKRREQKKKPKDNSVQKKL
jgi:hypothetical protein